MGWSNAEIVARLLSTRIVDTHVSAVPSKLNPRIRRDAVGPGPVPWD
jgi:hypothetical protein